MTNIWMTDDIGSTKFPVIRMVCDCGWVEKSFADRSGLGLAENHILQKHGSGLIHYKKRVVKVGHFE